MSKSSSGGGGPRTGVNKASFKKNFGGPGSQMNWKGRNDNPSKGSQSVGRVQGGEMKCYGCGAPGHMQRECPEGKIGEPKFKCFTCGEWGHKSPACPKPRGTTSFAPAGSSGCVAPSTGSQVRPGRVFAVTR